MKYSLTSQKPINKLSRYDKYILACANLVCASYYNLSILTRKNYVDKSLALLSSIELKNNKWRRLAAKCYLLKADLQYLSDKPIQAIENYKKLELILTKNRNSNNDIEKTLLALTYVGIAESLVKIEIDLFYPSYNQYLLYISKAIAQLNTVKCLTKEVADMLLSTYKSLALLLFSSDNNEAAIDIINLQFNYTSQANKPDFIEISNQLDLLELIHTENDAIPEEYNPYFTLLEVFDESIFFIGHYLDFSFGSINELLIFCLQSKQMLYTQDTINDIINYILYAIKYKKQLPKQNSVIVKEFNDVETHKELIKLVINLINKIYFKNTSAHKYSDILYRINQPINYKHLLQEHYSRRAANIYNIEKYKQVIVN